MRTYRMLVPGALLLAGCYWGPRAERFPAATTPAGATVEVHTPVMGRWRAELLAAEDSGLVVDGTSRLLFVPWAVVDGARVDGLGAEYVLPRRQPPDSARLARLRRVSRFPQGVSGPLLERLLALHAQPSVEVAR